MLKLDNSLLDELGLGSLPEDQKRAMLQHIYETLELRVGTNLANQMTDQQLEEFEKFIDEGGDTNQPQALQWLETNLPNYKQVVNDVFEALKAEIRQMAPQLLTASATTPAQQASLPTQPPVNTMGQGMSPTQPGPSSSPYDYSSSQNGSYAPTPAQQPYQPPASPQPQSDFSSFGQQGQSQQPQVPTGYQTQVPQQFAQPGPAMTSQQAWQQPTPAAPGQDMGGAGMGWPPAGQDQTQGQPGSIPPQPPADPQQSGSSQPGTSSGYPTFPPTQPPAGPGYPPQHPSQ